MVGDPVCAIRLSPSRSSVSIEVPVEGSFWILVLRDKLGAAGGIGIMPLHNILIYAAKEKLRPRIFFFVGADARGCHFSTKLQDLERRKPNFKLIACMTQVEKSPHSWSCERGLINGH